MIEYRKKESAIESDPKLNSQLVQFKEQKAQDRAEKAYRKAKQERKTLLADFGRPKLSVANAYILFLQETFPSERQSRIAN